MLRSGRQNSIGANIPINARHCRFIAFIFSNSVFEKACNKARAGTHKIYDRESRIRRPICLLNEIGFAERATSACHHTGSFGFSLVMKSGNAPGGNDRYISFDPLFFGRSRPCFSVMTSPSVQSLQLMGPVPRTYGQFFLPTQSPLRRVIGFRHGGREASSRIRNHALQPFGAKVREHQTD